MRQNADAHNRSDKRNIGIDLLRLFFAIVVVVHHIYGSQIHNEINYGYLAVEFFFFVSGYYIIQNDCEKDTVHYLLRLMKKLLPIVISAQIVFVTFELLYFEHDLSDYPSILFYSLFQALGLQTLGFPIYNMNDVLWFISAYFFVSSFIYAIMRRYGKQVIIDLLPISCGLIGLIYLFCGNIIGIWSHDFYNQWLLLRSFCDFNFGILAYVITSGLSRIKFKESGRHLMIAITIMVSLIIGIFMFLPFEHTYVEIVLFGLIWALLVLVMMIDPTNGRTPCRLKM